MKRRDFLKNTALASTALLTPGFISATRSSNLLSRNTGRKLVVIQLSGGNDGLNTVVPFRNDIYHRSRPSIKINGNEVLRLTDELGLNPKMQGLRALYDEGLLTVLNSVGYPNPNRSHFRSMDIWHTASDSTEYLNTGWLGRYLDSDCSGCTTPHHALQMGNKMSLALKGKERSGFTMKNVERMKRSSDSRFLQMVGEKNQHVQEENVAYLYKTMIETQESAGYLHQQAKLHKSNVPYPRDQFAQDLKQVAELITADTSTSVYYVNLGGFDTHNAQKGRQGQLLKRYADGLQAFVKDLKHNQLLDDVLIMTFSEFGRRVKQNASNGTDHGTANNVFLVGGKLKKTGFFNATPDLQNLQNGDLVYDIDFRQIYASILENWLDADARQILDRRFDALPIV